MFTLEQVAEIHERFGSKETLGHYLRALRDIGIAAYESFLADGHSEYLGTDGQKLVGPEVHEKFFVAETCDKNDFLRYLQQLEQGRIGYLEMSKGLADLGVAKWTFDTKNVTITYLDGAGNELLTEKVERP